MCVCVVCARPSHVPARLSAGAAAASDLVYTPRVTAHPLLCETACRAASKVWVLTPACLDDPPCSLRTRPQLDPFREASFVHKILSETQKEYDERRALSGQWWCVGWKCRCSTGRAAGRAAAAVALGLWGVAAGRLASHASDVWRRLPPAPCVCQRLATSLTRRRHFARRMPYHIGRENWFAYDTKKAWFWQPAKPAKKIGVGKSA